MVTEILLFSLLPLATMIIGGVVGTQFHVKNSIRSLILHLAAGVIFAVVAVDLLPSIVKDSNLAGISVGFFAGLVVMLLIKHFSHQASEKHKLAITNGTATVTVAMPWALLIGIAVDIFIDGILLGVGFAAGQSEGVLLGIALSIEILVLGLVVATELKTENFAKMKIIQIIVGLALFFVLGALGGSIMLSFLPKELLVYILAFGLSALMYLVTEELLIEAHELKDTPFNTAVFFIGFFVFLMIAIVH